MEAYDNWKPGITARFALEFLFQSLEISIEKSKNWNGNSMAKRAIFQFSNYLWKVTPVNQEEIKTSVNKIINRHKSILKMLKMFTLSSFKSSNLSALILGAIPEIQIKPVINSKNQKVIGWQSNQSYTNDLVFRRPFEAVISINWSKGKLIVLENWKRLVTYFNFYSNQTMSMFLDLK